MPLTVPTIDDRDYKALLEDARTRIPVHNPEWTNFNDSDPGITILQLFAFMTENLLYRSNLIPERNRLKFLTLLGIGLRPAAPANGVAVFSNDRGQMQTVTLPAGMPLNAGKIGFVTRNGLDVLPIDSQIFIRQRLSPEQQAQADQTYAQLFGSFQDGNTSFDYYETVPVAPPASAANVTPISLSDNTTVDNTLWVALLMRQREQQPIEQVRNEIAGKTITLGLMPSLAASGNTLPAGGPSPASNTAALVYQVSTGTTDNQSNAVYARLDARADDDPLQNFTLVQLTLPETIGTWNDLGPTEDGVGDLPPSLEDTNLAARVIAWIRITLPVATSQSSPALNVSFTWAGINATRIIQRIDVFAEPLGTGSGDPDQSYKLVNTPVLPDTVQIAVAGQVWKKTDDLFAAPPETSSGTGAQVFTVDAESGAITFGDGLHGARPPLGAQIVANYSYGGGSAGNVGIGVVKVSPQLPPGFSVANPLPTWAGDDGETTDQGIKEIPHFLRHRDRAVTVDDFKDIVKRTPGVSVGRVEVRPIYHPVLGSPAPGVVTVMAIPQDPAQQNPVPDKFFLDAICAYLDPKRLITTEIHVLGPTYVPLSVSVGIDVVPGKDIAPVREAVKQAIRTFLSPLTGGQTGDGWPLDKNVEDREVWAWAARVEGVASVRAVWLYDQNNQKQTTIPIQGLQLPGLTQVAAAIGDPEDITQPPGAPKKRLPVPVLPAQC